jgi:predicted nucleic acid-binding protein
LSLYLDTSVLVAMLMPDTLSERASRLLQKSTMTLAVSDWAGAEFASAVARHFRMGEITQDFARRVFAGLDEWVARETNRLETTTSDLKLAAIFVRRLELGLRASDALHIALAHHHNRTLASFDDQMIGSAKKLGIKIWAEMSN